MEELIVQSLYHRLVLIRVRRTREQPANRHGEGSDENASALQIVRPQSSLTSDAAASSEGLGKQFHIDCDATYGQC